MDKVTLTDNKQAVKVTIAGTDRYFRARRVSTESLPNSSGGQDFVDTVVQAQAYEVDGDGVEIGSGGVIKDVRYGLAPEEDIQAMTDRLANRAVTLYVSHLQSGNIRENIPDELI